MKTKQATNLRKKIRVIEDAAHATGSLYKGKKIGTHGSAVCFSFHPVKNLAMPTGGAISLNGKNSKKFENDENSKNYILNFTLANAYQQSGDFKNSRKCVIN